MARLRAAKVAHADELIYVNNSRGEDLLIRIPGHTALTTRLRHNRRVGHIADIGLKIALARAGRSDIVLA